MNKKSKAVVLLSGGLDSSTVLSIASCEGFFIYALSFNYGQRHAIELDKAKKLVASNPNIAEHKIIELDLRTIGGSALTDSSLVVPKNRVNTPNQIPITYVPARNTIFLSFALSLAETVGANDIFIGANIVDYSNYPDCRPEYLEAFEKMACLATATGATGATIKIHAPLLKLSKKQIIQKGLALGVNYSNTISCYDPSAAGVSCGECDSCIIRRQAFTALGLEDPVSYKKKEYA